MNDNHKKFFKVGLIIIYACVALFFVALMAMILFSEILKPEPEWIGFPFLIASMTAPLVVLIITSTTMAIVRIKLDKQKMKTDFDFDLKKINYEVLPVVDLFDDLLFKIEFLEDGLKFHHFCIDPCTNLFIPIVVNPKKKFNPAEYKQESLTIPYSEINFSASSLRNKPNSEPMFLLKISYSRTNFPSYIYAFAQDNEPSDFISVPLTRDVMFNLHKFNIPFDNASVCLEKRIEGRPKVIKRIRIGTNPLIWYIPVVIICFALGVGIGVATENSSAGIWVAVPLISLASGGLAGPKKVVFYEDFVYSGFSVKRTEIEKIELIKNAKNKDEIVLHSGMMFLSFNFSDKNLKFIKSYLPNIEIVDKRAKI